MTKIGDNAASAADQAKIPLRPLRPRELQDHLNYYFYHPLAWRLALLLRHTPVTPNMVSVVGGLMVAAAAIAYANLAWPVSALLGLALHMGWHIVDGADGDLARVTGRSSPTGELVDGICDYASHIILYLILGAMLYAAIGWTAWLWMLGAGIGHFVQANHVEVQRRQYQWWVYGTPWLRHTQAQVDDVRRKGFGAFLSGYLALAGGMTPHAKKIDAVVDAAQGDSEKLDRIRTVVRAEASPLLGICKLLGPNPRTIVLGIMMLLGGPLWYFFYQCFFQNALLIASVVMHNTAAKRIEAAIVE